MGYTVYSSSGLVLSRIVIRETSLVCRIFTQEFGVVTVQAESGARSIKFAPSLQVGSIGRYDFVRSRSGFKLVGVIPLYSVQGRSYDPDAIAFVRMCCAYILRFVPSDEQALPELYRLCVDAVRFGHSRTMSPSWWNSFRLKVLHILGYVSEEDHVQTRSVREVEGIIQKAEFSAQL